MNDLPKNLGPAVGHGKTAPTALRAELAVYRTPADHVAIRHRTCASHLAARVGRSIAQYGEILQGQMEGRNGSGKRRFLVSLPCDRLYSEVTFAASADGELRLHPQHKLKVKAVVELTLRRLGYDGMGGSVTVDSNIREGKGCGSSTADCVAAVRAVASVLGDHIEEEEVAGLVVEAEKASDNFMFRRAVLFAHRDGKVIEDLGPKLPRMDVLGFDTDDHGAVYTLEFPPAVYTWRQTECFHTLAAAIRRAVASEDVSLLGRVATASAAINQEFLPKPIFGEIRCLAGHVGALGISVAHSGTVMSILLDSSDILLERKAEQLKRELELLGVRESIRFQT